MKITVEIPDSEVKEICRVTGERKIGPAIRKLVADALLLKRREQLVRKFIDGEWGVELKGFEAGQAAGRRADRQAEQSERRSSPRSRFTTARKSLGSTATIRRSPASRSCK